jgi:hypothetical protein
MANGKEKEMVQCCTDIYLVTEYVSSMTLLVFENLYVATGILTGLYIILALHGYHKLKWLHGLSPELNTRKLFVMSCFLTSLLRVMSFGSLTAFNIGNYDLSASLDGKDDISTGRSEFFDKAMIVLFDFPDFSIISAYMLLTIIWAESFFQVSSFHSLWAQNHLIF